MQTTARTGPILSGRIAILMNWAWKATEGPRTLFTIRLNKNRKVFKDIVQYAINRLWVVTSKIVYQPEMRKTSVTYGSPSLASS